MASTKTPFVLASISPRRHQLLRELLDDFQSYAPQVDEAAFTTNDPFETAKLLAYKKAQEAHLAHPQSYCLGGDTVVAIPTGENAFKQLGKPASDSEAIMMLEQLSNRTHLVITALALIGPNTEICDFDVAKVSFRPLSRKEIEAYVATGEPMDKAGAYAVQAGGGSFIERIEGSQTCVIGLPMELLKSLLDRANIPMIG